MTIVVVRDGDQGSPGARDMWFRNFRLRRAAQRYVERLPAVLNEGWGDSDYYTPGQVRKALEECHFSGPCTVVAYAAFLTEDDFNRCFGTRTGISYQAAREIYLEHVPGPLDEAYAQDATGGGNGVVTGSNWTT